MISDALASLKTMLENQKVEFSKILPSMSDISSDYLNSAKTEADAEAETRAKANQECMQI